MKMMNHKQVLELFVNLANETKSNPLSKDWDSNKALQEQLVEKHRLEQEAIKMSDEKFRKQYGICKDY